MTLAIVQARLKSTRWPRKILQYIDGVPMLRRVTDAALAIRGVDCVLVAAPEADARVIQRVSSVPVVAVAGDENDVLRRFAVVADLLPSADPIVRLTADCPYLDPAISSEVVAGYQASLCRYVSNVKDGYIDGTDTEVFSRELLFEAHRLATDAHDREHVTPWMQRAVGWPTQVTPSRKTSIDHQQETV